MLEKLRAATQGWIGRSIMAIVMGLIILSFVIWGIGDIFRGFGANKLAQVGGVEITADAFHNAYQSQLQRLQRQLRRNVTNEEARQFGIDRQTLSRLIANAALDQQAGALNLAISDQEIAKAITNDPTFKGPGGRFDRVRFEEVLRDNGLNEKGFVREQRAFYLRQEITDGLTHGLQLPKAMLEAIHRYQTESRSVDYIVLPASAAGVVPTPSQDELKKYFDDREQNYSTSEYRGLVVLTLTPAEIAKPESVSDADAQKRYEEVKTERFGAPEKRAIEQILYADDSGAAEARAKLDSGKTFDDLLKEKNLTQKDASLGVVTRDGLVDKSVAAAAFALPEGQVSAPIKAQFGTVLLRVDKIIPTSVKPFSEVAADLKREIALQGARAEVARLHDAIEDQRASGKSLTEAAKSVGLEPRALAAVDKVGADLQGAPVADLPNAQALLKAVFASDIGVDNDTLRAGEGGYQWFEVANIDKARQKSFDEVKDEVEKSWRADETAKLLAAKSAELAKRLEAGESVAAIAAEGNLAIKHATNVKRSGAGAPSAQELTPPVVAQIFNVGLRGAGSARTEDGGRLLFQVTGAEVPAIDFSAPDLVAISAEVKNGLADDVLAQYLTKLEDDLGVKVNMQAFAAAAGASPDDY
ncbi:SurA N-terminal domain-containing protein [Methylocapsa polymorpha]|uniref:Parvulin-like PPIase n=1 Tax=Methylocapsa polymorpha TaxID=3080828 RepID=A0ABZ0HSB0_9HYPH|nr:SurA N-terminal domain-containing protein [Methylocapsa sp. RX1]